MPYDRVCPTCGKAFTALRNTGKFCSARCRGHQWNAGKNRVTIPRDLRFNILSRDGFTCRYCGGKPPVKELVVDHVVSVADGGPLTDPSNLVTSCKDCNSGKGALSIPPEWIPPTTEFPTIHLRAVADLLPSTEGATIARWLRHEDGTYEVVFVDA